MEWIGTLFAFLGKVLGFGSRRKESRMDFESVYDRLERLTAMTTQRLDYATGRIEKQDNKIARLTSQSERLLRELEDCVEKHADAEARVDELERRIHRVENGNGGARP